MTGSQPDPAALVASADASRTPSVARPIRVGSLCSGYEGIGLGLKLVFGEVSHEWFVEYDAAPSKILAHRFPGVPNHGDVKHTDWTEVAPIDLLTAGYPCQPFSAAGLRKGADDPRHLWPGVARAISVLRPGLVLLENVRGHVSLGLDAVLGDLAALGYDATWGVVRAADAGAPHGRARVFIIAADTQSEPRGVGDRDDVCAGSGADRRGQAAGRGAAADAQGGNRWAGQLVRPSEWREGDDEPGGRSAVPDTSGDGRDEGRAEPAGVIGGPDAPERGGAAPADADGDGRARLTGLPAERGAVHGDSGSDADGRGPVVEWGAYAAAIARWEAISGRPAPRPTEPGRAGERLSPRFVEWMMGLPNGWVTDVPGLTRNEQLKALGNGVVPQQAALATHLLLPQAVAA